MKIRSSLCNIEFEYLFLIFSFICIFSGKVREYFSSFFICYMFIVFHEFSHILVASLFNKKLGTIKFSLSGVNAKFENEKYKLESENMYIPNMFIYFAGPFSNILLAIIFYRVRLIYEINISLAFVNLIPIYPLDGYNILNNIFGECNEFKKELYLKYVENIFLVLLFLLSVYQILFFENITLLIFSVYISLIRKNDKKCF